MMTWNKPVILNYILWPTASLEVLRTWWSNRIQIISNGGKLVLMKIGTDLHCFLIHLFLIAVLFQENLGNSRKCNLEQKCCAIIFLIHCLISKLVSSPLLVTIIFLIHPWFYIFQNENLIIGKILYTTFAFILFRTRYVIYFVIICTLTNNFALSQ